MNYLFDFLVFLFPLSINYPKQLTEYLLWRDLRKWLIESNESIAIFGASRVAQPVKNLSAMQETWVWFLGQEDPLEKEMATHSSVLPWRIHGQRSLTGYGPWGLKSWDMT